jgi:uncharacterized damage-inducible protein DinB
MPSAFLEESLAILTRTPATLNAMLRDLPLAWTEATDGPNTWSAHTVLGHLVHGEQADWIPRISILLNHGPTRPFDPFDREAQFTQSAGKTTNTLLDEFTRLRVQSLTTLQAFHLDATDLVREGHHPAFGPVTLRQLIATWTAHDLAHTLQISRTLARRYRSEVGPWAQYLSVMTTQK